MTLNTSVKSLTTIILSTMILTACGGGDSDGGSTPNKSPDPTVSEPITSEPADQDNEQTDSEIVATDKATLNNNRQVALSVNHEISTARTSCGLNSLTAAPALAAIAIQHANYIKYVFASATPTVFNPHVENRIKDIASVTGNNNPFFTADSFAKRLANAKYANANNGTTENIAQSIYFNSIGDLIAPEIAASAMTKSLLAAPYHLRALMLPGSILTGTGVAAYKPYDKDSSKYQGYVLVNHATATPETRDKTVEGIFTYPCQDITGTVTALYNEAPNPVKGTGRDLQKDPIGQPIYISIPTAKTIKVSNVEFRDVQRSIDVPTQLLDFDNDPYIKTNYQLPANEAFILPITDSFNSCEVGKNKSGNCGLYGNSEYRVSFDVLVDNKDPISKSFTFKTGDVNY